MKELRIKYDFSHGPIWKDKFDANTGEWSTGISVIDNDETLNELNDEASKEFSALYYFDENGAFVFDNKLYEEKKDKLSLLLRDIVVRVNTLNDGSFFVIDEETSELK